MKISVIIPLYKGMNFLEDIKENMTELASSLKKKGIFIELILVNDYIGEKIKWHYDTTYDVKVINNRINLGIQQSRINGLTISTGKWIIFLDQDDSLSSDEYVKQVNMISENVDVIVGNAKYDLEDLHSITLYKNIDMEKLITEENMLKIRNIIASPGQCLIRKEAIPKEWKNNIMKINGADDWLLWLLMFNNHKKFVYNKSIIYHHKATESGNLSSDYKKMYDSCIEMLMILSKIGYPISKKQKLEKSIKFKYRKDTHSLEFKDYFVFSRQIIDNIMYKIRML